MKYAYAGSAFHDAIGEFYGTISDSPHGGLIEGTFQSILDRHWTSRGLDRIKEVRSRKETCFKNFVKFEKYRLTICSQYKPTLIEQRVRANINNIPYLTIPDVYWRQDEWIVDWKSGRMNSLGEKEFVQGQVEAMILRALGMPVKKVTFVCLLTGFVLDLPKIENEFVEAKVHKMLRYYRDKKFPKTKGDHCRWCGHQLRCEFQDRGWWLFGDDS